MPIPQIRHTDLAALFHRVANRDLVVHLHEARAVSVSTSGGCVLVKLKFLTSLSPNTWRYVHSLAVYFELVLETCTSLSLRAVTASNMTAATTPRLAPRPKE